VDRSSGEVTLLLLTAVVVLGIARTSLPRVNPVVIEGVHTNLALLVVPFGVIHVVTAIIDPFARLGVLDAVVPFVSAYRPWWLGLGVVSAYLYIAVVVSSWPARRLRRSAWLWIHRSMYVAWGAALIHSLATGSDARNTIFLLLDLVAVVGVLVSFLAWRVAEGMASRPQLWTGLATIAVIAALGLGLWVVNGPLQPGWAAASGTPPELQRSR
jgi:methionine sulfoxide reductase heme-binding subunit